MARWTEKQREFVEEYLISANKTDAARKAGYSNPEAQGHRLLSGRFPHVNEEVDKRQKERSEKAKIGADWVLNELVEAVETIKDSIKPKTNSRTGAVLHDEEGRVVYHRNDQALLTALKLIGQHVSTGAFKPDTQINLDDRLVERLQEGRKRAQGTPQHEEEPLATGTDDTKVVPIDRDYYIHGHNPKRED